MVISLQNLDKDEHPLERTDGCFDLQSLSLAPIKENIWTLKQFHVLFYQTTTVHKFTTRIGKFKLAENESGIYFCINHHFILK